MIVQVPIMKLDIHKRLRNAEWRVLMIDRDVALNNLSTYRSVRIYIKFTLVTLIHKYGLDDVLTLLKIGPYHAIFRRICNVIIRNITTSSITNHGTRDGLQFSVNQSRAS